VNRFADIKPIPPALITNCEKAVQTAETNPSLALLNLRLFGQGLAQTIAAFEGLTETTELSQSDRLNRLLSRGLLPSTLLPFFHVLDRCPEADEYAPTIAILKRSGLGIRLAERLAAWFSKAYGPHLTADASKAATLADILQVLQRKPIPDAIRKLARRAALQRATTMALSEEETRVIIDHQLRSAGWQADTWALRHGLGVRPEKGINKAIAEWPTATGPADYALFCGLSLIGVVEAKKMGKDVVSDLAQSKRYAQRVVLDGQAGFAGGPWDNFKVPFLFATNARPYLEQLKEKSGIWFFDARQATNHPRPLQGWYSAEDLMALLSQDTKGAHDKLASEPMDYLGLRDYQQQAVRRIEHALDQGQDRLLVAMATGTGKTRLAIGLIYRLIKSGRFRRILFVVDRNALGEQAGDKFKETRLEQLKTFDQIYDLKEVDRLDIEPTTKVNIATVQGLMRAVSFASEKRQVPSVGQYDCIIVDEAHRGYTLDRELGEDELAYRDQSDYLSKYRRVIDHFDAVKIGLTATPAPHTISIFGSPVFTYSYR